MTFFSFKKHRAAKAAEPEKAKKLPVTTVPKALATQANIIGKAFHVILRPHVTEKASVLSETGRNVYVFEVSRLADKRNVALAISELYKVVPEKIAVLKIPPKKSFVRGRAVAEKTRYKAYVYLKKGETIVL